MKIPRIISILLVLLLALPSLVGCAGDSAEVIKIGVIASLTGEVAVYGNAVAEAVKLYVEQFNEAGGIGGKKIKIIEYDDKGNATEAVNAYNRLVSSDNVVAIIGPVISTPTLSVAELSAADNVPMITGTATHPDVTKYGKNYFRACFEDPFQGGAITRFAADYLKAKSGAIIYNTSDAYSTGLKDSITATANEIGFTITATEGYAKGDVDFKAQLTNIIQTNPDVIFIPEYYQSAYLICKQARELGFTGTFLGVDGTDGILEMEGVDPSIVEGMYFANHFAADSTDPDVVKFVEDYNKKYGKNPNALAALGYDAAMILINAIKTVIENGGEGFALTNSAEHRQLIIDALRATELDCVTGNIKFDENNNPIKECVIIQIRDGANHFVANY
ncbi:MAG TPA: ABC transporter substrate-binding protein [Clostridiales bacterium]|nr:ABC transporter substrate-binding protein [Clostridiales bacterium]